MSADNPSKTGLIGRGAELETVCEHARCGKHLAVFGAEGVGKTALLQEAVSRIPDAIYCANTATLKTACDSLSAVLGLLTTTTQNAQRKRAILDAVCGRRLCFVFDHVRWVAPKLLSFLENLRESHTLIVAARSLSRAETGHLWDFDRLELRNLGVVAARQLILAQIEKLGLKIPDSQRFEHDVMRLSHGNPRLIVELCEQADKGHCEFARGDAALLIDLDHRINRIRGADFTRQRAAAQSSTRKPA